MNFEGENFHELVKIRFSQRKLSRIAHFCSTKEHHTPKFHGENFHDSHKVAKFAKVFSLESFLLYGTVVHMYMYMCMHIVAKGDTRTCGKGHCLSEGPRHL